MRCKFKTQVAQRQRGRICEPDRKEDAWYNASHHLPIAIGIAEFIGRAARGLHGEASVAKQAVAGDRPHVPTLKDIHIGAGGSAAQAEAERCS